MIFEHTSYRSYLKSVLAERVSKNPAYSLRAMANSLEMYPSYLSEVTKGSKNLSQQNALRIARKLGLKLRESEYFCLLVQYESAKSPDLKETLSHRMRSLNRKQVFQDISVDSFKLISDWYHAAITEMTTLEGFVFTPKNIAKRLGITALEAEVAIERLQRLGLLVQTESGAFKKANANTIINPVSRDLTVQAIRHFHKQMLEKAIDSIETQSTKERYLSSSTFAFDTELLDEAIDIIEDFFSKISELHNRSTKKEHVYHLATQLFNLTKGTK